MIAQSVDIAHSAKKMPTKTAAGGVKNVECGCVTEVFPAPIVSCSGVRTCEE